MTTPPKAKKNPRNQPIKFDETLAVVLPQMAAPVSVEANANRTRLSPGQFKLILWSVWLLAAACAGIGIGRLIIAAQLTAQDFEPPTPVATATVAVTAVPALAITGISHSAATAALAVTPAGSTNQAHAGQPFIVIAEAVYQPAAGSSALQPGFSPLGHLQGNLGTLPVH